MSIHNMPSATANWCLNLLRSCSLPDAQLASTRCPAVLCRLQGAWNGRQPEAPGCVRR